MIHDIADTLGRKEIAAVCDVPLQAVSNAVRRGGFPPAWFLAVSELAKVKGIDCPACLFSMRGFPKTAPTVRAT